MKPHRFSPEIGIAENTVHFPFLTGDCSGFMERCYHESIPGKENGLRVPPQSRFPQGGYTSRRNDFEIFPYYVNHFCPFRGFSDNGFVMSRDDFPLLRANENLVIELEVDIHLLDYLTKGFRLLDYPTQPVPGGFADRIETFSKNFVTHDLNSFS
jgi:hypothetical protein